MSWHSSKGVESSAPSAETQALSARSLAHRDSPFGAFQLQPSDITWAIDPESGERIRLGAGRYAKASRAAAAGGPFVCVWCWP